MQSRLFTREIGSAFSIFAVICTIGFGPLASNGAEAGLANIHTLSIDGRSLTLEIAQNEYLYIAPDGSSEHRVTAVQPSADAMRQLALNAEQGGGEARLILYVPGSTRTKESRYYLSRDLLVKLDAGADVNGLAAAFGLTYRGSLSYYPGMHIYRAGAAGQALSLVNSVSVKPGVLSVQPVFARHYEKFHVPNDPLFTNQWHLLNIGQNGAAVGSDVNITNAWDKYRGSNVFLGVFDDGFDLTHPDLVDNLLTNMAFNAFDGSQDVSPRAGDFHGTAVTGIAAARGDNNEGLSGSAPNANVVPIRFDFINGLTSLQIADGLLHSNNIVQVHNNSWGRNTAFFLSDLSSIMSNAFETGITFGRGGLGTIYVFSSGNDGDIGDDVNYSGITKSMLTMSVNALNDLGNRASYSTFGAGSVISAPAGLDQFRFQGSPTTDVQGTNGYNPTINFPLVNFTNLDYNAHFNGTSSAAPLVSGIVALILEANPALGWRDVQEIVMRSAALTDTNNTDWITNDAGFHFNHEYGAGIIDASAAVALAETWTNLPFRTNLTYALTNLTDIIPDFDPVGVTKTITVDNPDFRLEHVQLRASIPHASRGDLEITLTSPDGTSSTLARRHFDFNPDYNDWTFMTVRNWGEIAAGGPSSTNSDWTIKVADLNPGNGGLLDSFELILWGSVTNSSLVGLTNPPVILQHPLSKAATKNSSAFFNVDALGTPPLAYRWFRNGIELSGQNNPTLFLDNVSKEEEGIYTVRVFNQFGNSLSAGAALFVNAPPEISTQPLSLTNSLGGDATFNVAAIGNSPLRYQWRFNGRVLTNENDATLTVTNVQTDQLGSYDVIVFNPISSIISDSVLLSATNVLSSFSFGGFVPASSGGGSFGFNVSGGTGQVIRIDATTDFVTWTPVATNVLVGGSGAFSDGVAFTYSNRYYRVVPIE